MTVSPVKEIMKSFINIGRSLCLIIGVASISLALNSAVAQNNDAPRTLSPRTLNPISSNAFVPVITPVPIKTISGGINVQSLDNVSREALGVLSGKEAFSSTMWMGVERNFVEQLIKTLPSHLASSHLRIMQRRLLLSAAQPPKGTTGSESLLSLRAHKLAEMGQTQDVLSLLTSSSQTEQKTQLNILETESLLIQGQLKQACALSAGHMQTSPDVFWLKAMAFCRMLAKQTNQAMLSLSLLQENGEIDEVFYNLMEALGTGETAEITNLVSPKPLDLALIQVTKANISKEILKTEDPSLLAVLAKFAQLKTDQRLSLVQKAVSLGLLKIEDLRLAYLAIGFKEDALNDPITHAEKIAPVKAQALLYQVSAKQGQLAVIKTETIALALELAQKNNRFISIAKLYQPLLSNMKRTIDMLWFAPQAVRALLAAGDWENAKAWTLMIRNAAFTDGQAAVSWVKLRPLITLAGFDIAPQATPQALTKWSAAQETTPAYFKTATLLYSMIDGLGLPLSNDLWLSLMEGPHLRQPYSPKPAIWIKTNKAAIAGRMGETLLMVLHGFAQHDLKDVNTTFLRDSLFALRMVGLEQDARILAVETALHAGL